MKTKMQDKDDDEGKDDERREDTEDGNWSKDEYEDEHGRFLGRTTTIDADDDDNRDSKPFGRVVDLSWQFPAGSTVVSPRDSSGIP
jgi:chromatin remodeling complex protein RSC6